MEIGKIVLYRIFLPGLAVLIVPLVLPMTGLISYGLALVVQVAGVIAIISLNLLMGVLHDIPETYPDSAFTKQLNRLPFIGDKH